VSACRWCTLNGKTTFKAIPRVAALPAGSRPGDTTIAGNDRTAED